MVSSVTDYYVPQYAFVEWINIELVHGVIAICLCNDLIINSWLHGAFFLVLFIIIITANKAHQGHNVDVQRFACYKINIHIHNYIDYNYVKCLSIIQLTMVAYDHKSSIVY